jgi:hypothetical protein
MLGFLSLLGTGDAFGHLAQSSHPQFLDCFRRPLIFPMGTADFAKGVISNSRGEPCPGFSSCVGHASCPMKKLVLTLSVICCALCPITAMAQDKGPGVENRSPAGNSGPDWQSSYQEELARDYIRRRAQERTAARQARIEGLKWLGYSPARPIVSATPFMSSPPTWASVAPTGYWGPVFWPTLRHGHTPGWLP